MASLVQLPTELLDEILSHISRTDLSKLTRTCTILEARLRPRIFNTIEFNRISEVAPGPPFLSFLRTVCLNPHLARMVKTLRLKGWGTFKHNTWLWSRRAYPDDARSVHQCCVLPFCAAADLTAITTDIALLLRVKAIVAEIYRPEPDIWIREYQRGSLDVLVALTLSQLHGLRALELEMGWLHCVSFSRFIPAMLRYLTCTPTFFPNLKTVKLARDKSGETAYFTPDLDGFRSFFYAPGIETLDVVAMEPVVFAWPSSSEPKCMALTTLTLRQCTISEKTLARLLSCTPRLKHLTYDRWVIAGLGPPHWDDYSPDCFQVCTTNCFNEHMEYREFNCRVLDEALVHVQDTLESLTIKLRFEMQMKEGEGGLYDHDWMRCGVVGRMRSLRGMERLRVLEVPWVVLHGWEAGVAVEEERWEEVLPRGLGALRLRDDTSRLRYYKYDGETVEALVRQLVAWHVKAHSPLCNLAFLYAFDWRGYLWGKRNQRVYEGNEESDEEIVTEDVRRVQEVRVAHLASLRELCGELGCQIVHEDARS
ncbi:hypothetical protein NX059_005887 [Plenodomus lindquistii]|nr:hypothetical protein NX059_005887 [Plenodomus lindquistii]